MKKLNNRFLVLLAACSMAVVSCQQEAEAPQVLPTETQVDRNVFEGDHITVTPEREREIAKWNLERAQSRVAAENYRGFIINWGSTVPSDIKSLVKADIDRIFTSGATATTIARMKTAGINVFDGGSSGNLYYTGGQVYITSFSAYRTVQSWSPKGPVIFHELIHYLHDRYLSGGFNNTTVANLYNNAYSRSLYPRTEYVLRNRAEYLATSSEAYFPATARVPYNRSYVTSHDPNAASFIGATF